MCAGDREAFRLKDAGLLGRDRLERRPQVLGVVECDVRDDFDAQVEDVRGVETTAESHLADEQVDAGAREIVEGGAGQDLEFRRCTQLGRHITNGRLHLGEQCREVGLADRSLINLDPLGVGNEVRLGHQPDAIARHLQDARHHGADRAFAVGPGHLNALE